MENESANQIELERLIVDNPDLERLEALLDQFNIFEAMGTVRQELRHSDFLAFLLNPRHNHGLEDRFFKRFLQRVIKGNVIEDLPFNPIDLELWDLDEAEVRREWQNIDILLLHHDRKFAVIIENKILGGERADQLERYRRSVRQHFHDFSIVSIYLTPEGDEPTDDIYIPISYRVIHELIKEVVNTSRNELKPDVVLVLSHYAQMLERYVMAESEIQRLCQEIYRKHQRALDLIYEYRPDRQADIHSILEGLFKDTPEIVLDHSTKSKIKFWVKDWDFENLKVSEGWTPSKRILLFEFQNSTRSLKLTIVIGPGPREVRQRLLDMAQQNQPPFRSAYKALNQKYNNIFTRSIFSARSYEATDIEDIEAKIRSEWEKFLTNDLRQFGEIIKSQAWILQSDET